MTHPTEPRVEVTQADEELGLKLWRVHPDEILAQGTTRPQWYAQEIARHRTATEAAWKARALGAMDEALLQGMNGASAPVSWLEGYCAAATIAKEAIARAKATSEGGGHA